MPAPKPTLSVIVPAYNVELYIDAALDALLAQAEPFHEIIVVDDGSSDGTPARLARRAGHANVRIVRTPNRGLGPARNEGLAHATGEYVYFFDADDLLPPHFVGTVGAMLDRGPCLDLLFFSGTSFADEGLAPQRAAAIWHEEFRRRVEGVFASGLDAAGALLGSGMFSPSACLYVSRRALWDDTLRFKPVIHEDDELIMRLCARAGATRVVRAALFLRRVRAGSIMSAPHRRRNAAGYFSAIQSTWAILGETASPGHRATLHAQFRAQAWQYLNACRQAGLRPPLRELAFLLARPRHMPHADLLRTLAPAWLRPVLRRARALLRRPRLPGAASGTAPLRSGEGGN